MSIQNICRAARESIRQTPFARLVSLSLSRILHGAQEDSDEIDSDVGRMFVLLALPGAIVCFALFDKYGSLMQFFRGQRHFNPYAASLTDEYFFIVMSMAVCGAVAAWKADSIFLDRRDYQNLVPLPISTQLILLANITALLLFAALFAFDINAVSGWLFPVVVSASQSSFTVFLIVLFGHIISVTAASLFSFLSVFALIGAAMALLPASIFRRISMYLNSAIVVAIFFLLSTPYSFSSMLTHGSRINNSCLRFVPSLWFLGLCDTLRGPQLVGSDQMSVWAVVGLGVTLFSMLLTYSINYRRHFLRIGEGSEAAAGKLLPGFVHPMGIWADRMILRTPFEQAGYRFIFRTLARSPRHRLVLSAFIGAGIVISVQLSSMAAHEAVSPIPSVHWFSIAFIINFCIIIGMRFSFDIPAEIRAKWTFQLLVKPETHKCIPLARKAILSVALPLTWMVGLPLYITQWGWKIGFIHVVLITVASLFLTEIVLANFRKIPFTCRYPEFEQGSIVGMFIAILGFVIFSFAIPALERWAISSPWRLMAFVPLIAVGWNGLASYRAGLIDSERQLTFQEESPYAVELLRLNTQ